MSSLQWDFKIKTAAVEGNDDAALDSLLETLRFGFRRRATCIETERKKSKRGHHRLKYVVIRRQC